ncbi:MAG TPA: tetratricopeptide repeat protein, partial [Blastocatellia bacterium]
MFHPGVPFRASILGLLLVASPALFTAHVGFAQQPDAQAYFGLVAQAEARMSAKEWGEAAALWEKAIGLNPAEGRLWDRLSEARYNLKDYRRVIAANEKVIELGYGSPATAAYIIASNYALLGETEQALSWLEKAFGLGFRNLRQAQTSPVFQSLRHDPRYQKLVALADVSKMSRVQGWRYDLQLLAREVKRMAHSSFRGAKEEGFDASVKKLHAAIPRLTDAQVIVELMRLMRKVGDGHSGIFLSGERAELRQTLPVLFYLFEEGLFVIAADPKHKELLGAQVLRFGDRTVAEVVQ